MKSFFTKTKKNYICMYMSWASNIIILSGVYVNCDKKIE